MAGSSEEAPDCGRGVVVNANSRLFRAESCAPGALPTPSFLAPSLDSMPEVHSGERGPATALFFPLGEDRFRPQTQPSPFRSPPRNLTKYLTSLHPVFSVSPFRLNSRPPARNPLLQR